MAVPGMSNTRLSPLLSCRVYLVPLGPVTLIFMGADTFCSTPTAVLLPMPLSISKVNVKGDDVDESILSKSIYARYII